MSLAKPKRQIPTNSKTIAFAFFEGAVLSFPVGILLSYIRPFTPPAWTAPVYYSVFLFSDVALLVWSLMSFRDLPRLALIGLVTSLTIIVSGLLLPAL